MKKAKLDELLKSGAVTEEEYKELLPTCEDDSGEPDDGESNPEDPLAGLDEKTRAAVEKMLQSERDRAANRVGNAKKKELEDSKRQYEELKAALEELKKAKLTEDERKELERKEAADKLAAQQKEFAEMKNRYLAAQELKAAGLDIADDIVSLVLGADEDDTKARVKSFADLIDKLVADKVKRASRAEAASRKRAAAQWTPRVTPGQREISITRDRWKFWRQTPREQRLSWQRLTPPNEGRKDKWLLRSLQTW